MVFLEYCADFSKCNLLFMILKESLSWSKPWFSVFLDNAGMFFVFFWRVSASRGPSNSASAKLARVCRRVTPVGLAKNLL